MLTAELHAELVSLAGPNFDYAGVSGSSRPPADIRKQLRLDLIERQGGICPVCAQTLLAPQFNHVVSRGDGVKGFLRGNLFAGCATCNLDCAIRFGNVTDDGMVKDGGIIPLSHFIRPDLIPSEWTPNNILRERHRQERSGL